jgi:hypothetical protein
MPKLSLGGKITKSHSSLTETAEKFVYEAVKLESISKIGIASITHIGGGGRKSLKFLPITGGIKAIIRGSGSVQEIYIYTDKIDSTKLELQKIFEKI